MFASALPRRFSQGVRRSFAGSKQQRQSLFPSSPHQPFGGRSPKPVASPGAVPTAPPEESEDTIRVSFRILVQAVRIDPHGTAEQLQEENVFNDIASVLETILKDSQVALELLEARLLFRVPWAACSLPGSSRVSSSSPL